MSNSVAQKHHVQAAPLRRGILSSGLVAINGQEFTTGAMVSSQSAHASVSATLRVDSLKKQPRHQLRKAVTSQRLREIPSHSFPPALISPAPPVDDSRIRESASKHLGKRIFHRLDARKQARHARITPERHALESIPLGCFAKIAVWAWNTRPGTGTCQCDTH